MARRWRTVLLLGIVAACCYLLPAQAEPLPGAGPPTPAGTAPVAESALPTNAPHAAWTNSGRPITASVQPGQVLDAYDRQRLSIALEKVPTGVASIWRNYKRAVEYMLVPVKTFAAQSIPCREFTLDYYVDYRRHGLKGRACRRLAGAWEIDEG
jgi:surface antigen